MSRFPCSAMALLLAWGVFAIPAAQAQQAPPSSGQLLQEVERPAATQPAQAPDVDIEQAPGRPASDATPFRVERIVVEGNAAFDGATLHALVASAEGSQMTLGDLQALAARITRHYQSHGYPLARALVPPQVLDDGTVRLRVVEARYDAVLLENESRVGEGLLEATLAPLAPGALVTRAALDRSLLLLGDLPGVQPRAILRPGADVGTSTLVVQAAPTPVFSGVATLDNAGNRYTGRARLGAWLQVDNPLRHGDRLDIDVLTGGEDLAYGRLGYETTLNGRGTRLGAAYSMLDYALGAGLEALDVHGTARVASAWLTQPFVRTRHARVDGRVQFDRRDLRDHVDSVQIHGERHSNSVTASLAGQRSDDHGITSATFGVTVGDLAFDDATAAAADAATAGTAGSYLHWNASVSRLQVLGPATRLLVSLAGKASNDNLDSSEQFLLGGAGSVRGYEVGSVAGASGYLLTLELRRDLAWFDGASTEGVVFLDSGEARINPKPWTSDPNRARLTAAGIGLNWRGPRQWTASVQVAGRIGDAPVLAGEQDAVRAWVRIGKGF